MSRGKAWRHLRFGLATVLGLKKLGYFIPYRYASGATPPRDYPDLIPAFRPNPSGGGASLRAAPAVHPADVVDRRAVFFPA